MISGIQELRLGQRLVCGECLYLLVIALQSVHSFFTTPTARGRSNFCSWVTDHVSHCTVVFHDFFVWSIAKHRLRNLQTQAHRSGGVELRWRSREFRFGSIWTSPYYFPMNQVRIMMMTASYSRPTCTKLGSVLSHGVLCKTRFSVLFPCRCITCTTSYPVSPVTPLSTRSLAIPQKHNFSDPKHYLTSCL